MLELALHPSPTLALQEVLADRHVDAAGGRVGPCPGSQARQVPGPPVQILLLPSAVHEPAVGASAAGVLEVVAEDDVHGEVRRRVPVAAVDAALADVAQEIAADIRRAGHDVADPTGVYLRDVLVGTHLPSATAALPASLRPTSPLHSIVIS